MSTISLIIAGAVSLMACTVFIHAVIGAPEGAEGEAGFISSFKSRPKAKVVKQNFHLPARLLKSKGNGITAAHS